MMKTRTMMALLVVCALANVVGAAEDLAKRFVSPPESAKPRAYWFHMSGNITKAGITADLEAMREIGLGGTLFMNVSVGVPEGLVETKDFLSPAWQDCFQHMLNESAGWASNSAPPSAMAGVTRAGRTSRRNWPCSG